MIFSNRLSSAEIEILQAMVGQDIKLVSDKMWNVIIETSSTHLSINPNEVLAETEENPYGDSNRPTVTLSAGDHENEENQRQKEEQEQKAATLQGYREWEGLGKVDAVYRAFLIVSPTFNDNPEPVIQDGEEIPVSGVEMGCDYYKPSELGNLEKKYPQKAFIELDIGVLLKTDSGHMVALYTYGYAFFVNVEVDGTFPEDWSSAAELLQIA